MSAGRIKTERPSDGAAGDIHYDAFLRGLKKGEAAARQANAEPSPGDDAVVQVGTATTPDLSSAVRVLGAMARHGGDRSILASELWKQSGVELGAFAAALDALKSEGLVVTVAGAGPEERLQLAEPPTPPPNP